MHTAETAIDAATQQEKMLNSRRIFVDAVRRYCADRGIAFQIKSEGWLLIMQKGTERRFALGYDLGLNSSITHRIANDKAATADVLEACGIPSVAHTPFLNPKLSVHIPRTGSWEAMLQLLGQNPQGIVVKPNEGTGGNSVFRVCTHSELELAVSTVFSTERSLAVSPYLTIDEEVRVILIDDIPVVVYGKSRPSVVGDGKQSVLQLALAAIPGDKLLAALPDMTGDLDRSILSDIPPVGQRRAMNWRHNLGRGAEPVLLEDGAIRQACVDMALTAAQAIALRFGSVDVVKVDGSWRILEINSGVMMEALNGLHPDLVDSVYHAALDKIFS
jgi:glutathione synthase/RimK-type ligase-like ATP-grasp enzyme